MILFKDDIFYILALSLSSFSDFQSLAEPKILLSSVCGHGVAEGEDVVTDVVDTGLLQGYRIVQQVIPLIVHDEDQRQEDTEQKNQISNLKRCHSICSEININIKDLEEIRRIAVLKFFNLTSHPPVFCQT